VKRYLFANSRPGVPFSFDGGAERTTFALLSGLARNGLAVVGISTFPQGDIEWAKRSAASMGMAVKLLHAGENGAFKVNTDHLQFVDGSLSIIGVHPSAFSAICRQVASEYKPDLLVTWLKGSDYVVQLGQELNIPTILRIVGPYSLEGYPEITLNTIILANSPVTAQIASEHYHRDANFLLSLIEHADYVAEDRNPHFVTYVNPRAEKGVHLFCRIAGLLPDLQFLVVRGWSRTRLLPDEKRAMEFLTSLPNVAVASPVTDMREVYRSTRILLLPSRWPEAWARVVGEAQANGIPIIASDRGSSPQEVGNGGIILPYGDPRLWASIIRLLHDDDALRSNLESNAKTNIGRFEAEKLLEGYLKVFAACAERKWNGKKPASEMVRTFRGFRDSQGRPQVIPDSISMLERFDLSEPAFQ